MMWQTGPQPDQIVDEDGEHIGFTDAGWASQIIKAHNETVKNLVSATEAPVVLPDCKCNTTHKYHE